MNEGKDTTKWYVTQSSFRGWVEDKKKYLEFPTEEEYYEYIREDANE